MMKSTLLLFLVFLIHICTCQSQATIPPKCSNADQVPVKGQCQKLYCRSDIQCIGYKSYCAHYKIGTPLCRGLSGVCGCNGERSSVDKNGAKAKSCNRNLNGNTKCAKGQVCFPRGECGPDPGCAFHGESCVPNKEKCCDKDTYCHKRASSSSYSCVYNAFVGDACASGIPCEKTSQCVNGKCSLRNGDECSDGKNVCPSGHKCRDAPLSTRKHQTCQRF